MIDLVLPLLQKLFTPSQAVSINEAMIGFRGPVRGKPTPWEIKAYVLSDTGYLYSVVMYYGHETADQQNHT